MFDGKSVSEKYIARYYIMEELASSSSSRIFLAKQNPSLPLPLVIKLFYSVRMDTLQEEAYFLAEIRLHRQLQHPFILPIMDSGVDKCTPYLVMPYLPSGSLYDRMLHSILEPFSLEHTLTILSQIGQALHHAHNNHIFHGNLKPRNILLHEDGYVQLTDFTCLTVQSNRHSNPDSMLYMSPEQLNGKTNALSDQYALGCLAYELFTSRTFFRSSFSARLQKETAVPPTHYNPLLPPHVEQAILKATSLKSARRYPNVLAFINALTLNHTMIPPIPIIPSPSSLAYKASLAMLPTLDNKQTSSTHLPEQDTLELLFLEDTNQTLSSLGTSISKQTTSPQVPILPTSNPEIATAPSPQSRKSLQLKSLFLLVSSIIVVLLIWNLIPSLKLLSPSNYSTVSYVPTTSIFQPSTSIAMQLPTATPIMSNQAQIPASLIVTNQFQVSPALFSPSNCTLANGNYLCTATLFLSPQFKGQLNWQASSPDLPANFSTTHGRLVPGQTTQEIIYIPTTCPSNSTIDFWGSGLITTARWIC